MSTNLALVWRWDTVLDLILCMVFCLKRALSEVSIRKSVFGSLIFLIALISLISLTGSENVDFLMESSFLENWSKIERYLSFSFL